MKSKLLKYALLAGVGYVALKQTGVLAKLGLGDLTDDVPTSVDVPYQYGYNGYGYNPYQYPYAVPPITPFSEYYGGGYPNPQFGYPFGNYPPPAPPTPSSQPAYFNPFGGYSVGGQYIPKVVTASGGVQGIRGLRR